MHDVKDAAPTEALKLLSQEVQMLLLRLAEGLFDYRCAPQTGSQMSTEYPNADTGVKEVVPL